MRVAAIVGVVALCMLIVERFVAGRRFPKVHNWWLRAIALNAGQVGSVYLAGVAWDGFMLRTRPWSLDALGPVTGGVLGYAVITFIYYWWHRARHEVDLLWRVFHQVHHSPQRIEIITSFYKHPIEIVVNGLLSSAILYWVCGVGPEAASLAVLLSGLAELVYHWNVRTPYWLGFIVQRPESHCVHHQESHHRQNFADLPLWDMLFGTFHNPRAWDLRCGFGEREHELLSMLSFRDVFTAERNAVEKEPRA